MFCPTCARDASDNLKFCPSCGTNLEAVTKALSGNTEGIFFRANKSQDKFIARYAAHFFEDALTKALDRPIRSSWKILGQGIITAFINFILLLVMMIVLPARFLSLLVYTPFSLLSERSLRLKSVSAIREGTTDSQREPSLPKGWLNHTVPSVAEHTTVNLSSASSLEQNAASKINPTR